MRRRLTGESSGAGRIALATGRFRGRQSFIHNAADGAGAAAALGAATKAMVDLAGRARRLLSFGERCAYVLIRQNVARAYDHCRRVRRNWYDLKLSLARAKIPCKEKILFIGILIIAVRNSSLIDY